MTILSSKKARKTREEKFEKRELTVRKTEKKGDDREKKLMFSGRNN